MDSGGTGVITFSHFENGKRPWFVVTGINRHTRPNVCFGNWKEIEEFAKAVVENDVIIVKCVCQTE